jgi:hypothetical protein
VNLAVDASSRDRCIAWATVRDCPSKLGRPLTFSKWWARPALASVQVDAERPPEDVARWRVVGWHVVAVAIPCGFLAASIDFALGSPIWARLAAVAAAGFGVVFGSIVTRMSNRDRGLRDTWVWWAVAGAVGSLVGGAPDRVMLIVMAFLTALVAALIVNAERRRQRSPRTPPSRTPE